MKLKEQVYTIKLKSQYHYIIILYICGYIKGVLVNVDSTSDAGQALPWEPYWSQYPSCNVVSESLWSSISIMTNIVTKIHWRSLTSGMY